MARWRISENTLPLVGLVLLVALVLSPFMAPGYFWRSVSWTFSWKTGCTTSCRGSTAGLLLTAFLGATGGLTPAFIVLGIMAILWTALVLVDYELDARCPHCQNESMLMLGFAIGVVGTCTHK
jgi:hypothetical protein